MTKILVLDDSELVRTVLCDMLSKKGYEVITADRGEDALSKLKTERPLLMILDVRMPGMDGMEVLARAKAEYPALKVIMLTGVVDEWLAQTAISAGGLPSSTNRLSPTGCRRRSTPWCQSEGFQT